MFKLVQSTHIILNLLIFACGLDVRSFQHHVSPGTWILWQKHLVPPKLPNYQPMQNAWSMDFISWFFTHVSQLVFMLLASLPVGWPGRGGGDNEGERMSQYHQQKTKWPKCRETGLPVETLSGRVHCLCDHAEGDRHWLCAVWHRITAERKGQGQMAWKVKKWLSITQRPEMNDAARMCFSSLAVNQSWNSFLFFWSQREMYGDILQSLVY